MMVISRVDGVIVNRIKTGGGIRGLRKAGLSQQVPGQKFFSLNELDRITGLKDPVYLAQGTRRLSSPYGTTSSFSASALSPILGEL